MSDFGFVTCIACIRYVTIFKCTVALETLDIDLKQRKEKKLQVKGWSYTYVLYLMHKHSPIRMIQKKEFIEILVILKEEKRSIENLFGGKVKRKKM